MKKIEIDKFGFIVINVMSLLRRRWKRLTGLGILWFVAMFPIPILPFLGVTIPPEAITAIITVLIIITIPFFFLAIFMK
ncbi:MAG: hypothetical protein KatS3mg003_1564 [Candidatus Nitrosocaldaceae archaeon]|nr:MAG: hypothetical protein KatS3mg003_1564 [Candidatus Nitrosocaldaceae archaeon]